MNLHIVQGDMAGVGKEQNMRTKEKSPLVMNLRLLGLKVSHGTGKLIRSTKMDS